MQLLSQLAGTNYCGKNNKSVTYGDIGNDPADICCRDHDKCPLWVFPNDRRYGYNNNNSLITQVHCQCDKE